MFKTMTTNPPYVPGKRAGEESLDGKASHFNFGDAKMGDEKSTTSMAFTGYPGQKLEKTKPMPKPVSQIVMGDTACAYITNTQASFTGMPKNFVKAKPLKKKQDLVKTNYSVRNKFFVILLMACYSWAKRQ